MDTRGIYPKYIVHRTDRNDGPGQKHSVCDYFVLDLTHDPAARTAVRAYIKAVKRTRPNLAAQLEFVYGRRGG